MTGRSFTRHKGAQAEAPEPAANEGLRPGEILRGGGLPDGRTYLVGEPLPPRWGRLRLQGFERESGAQVELWCAREPGVALPGPLMQLLPLRHRGLQPLLHLCRGPRGHAVAVLGAAAGAPLQAPSRPLSPSQALLVLAPLGRALDALHAAGLCHLELRPEHILVGDGEDELCLGGLGRAQAEGGAALEGRGAPEPGADPPRGDDEGVRTGDSADRLASSALLPISAYLAPEQILPERAGLLHRRTDVYALSALSFHLLAGAPPFGPDGVMATLGAHLAAWRPLCSTYRADLGEAVDAVLQRGFALAPEGRPPSCGELLDDLRAALASAPPPAPSPIPVQPCVLVVAGSAAARRELQGMVAAVSPRNPVLADGGAHAVTLALRYRPQLIVVHQPSLLEPEVLSLCRRLCAEPALSATQLVVQLQQLRGASAQELARLGVSIASGSSPSSSSSQSVPRLVGGHHSESRPLLQMLRRLLLPGGARPPRRPLV